MSKFEGTVIMKESFKVFSDKVFEGVGGGGKLIPIEFKDLPFVPRRVFTVSGVHEMELRGGHAHRSNRQVLVCVAGSITIHLQRPGEEEREQRLVAGEWVLHTAMEWCEVEFWGRESAMLSLCSDEYDPDDYIHSFRELDEAIKVLNIMLSDEFARKNQ